jgi:hypothetical protein
LWAEVEFTYGGHRWNISTKKVYRLLQQQLPQYQYGKKALILIKAAVQVLVKSIMYNEYMYDVKYMQPYHVSEIMYPCKQELWQIF